MAELNSVIGNTETLSDGTVNGVLELHAEINYSVSGGGTGDYNQLVNKPTINGVVLQGNITTGDIGIKNGENGKDGFSPIITQEENDSGYYITITDAEGKDGFQLLNGRNGSNGKSAYLIAIDNGFQGTEEEWLESLKGQNGQDGADGKSAYEIAVEQGFVGSEDDWLASLKGKDGVLADAPSDGKLYGRQNETWVEVTGTGGGGGIPEAPADSKAYARKDNTWVETVEAVNVYTKTEADEAFLPKTTVIPTKTSDLTNDSGFITSIPDEYVTQTEMVEYAQPKGEYVTNMKLQEYAQPKGDYALKSELFSKSYNDLTDKPTIPTNTSELTNDSGFITSIPEQYATTSYVQAYAQPKGNYATTEYVDGQIGDISSILDNINGEVV